MHCACIYVVRQETERGSVTRELPQSRVVAETSSGRKCNSHQHQRVHIETHQACHLRRRCCPCWTCGVCGVCDGGSASGGHCRAGAPPRRLCALGDLENNNAAKLAPNYSENFADPIHFLLLLQTISFGGLFASCGSQKF